MHKYKTNLLKKKKKKLLIMSVEYGNFISGDKLNFCEYT